MYSAVITFTHGKAPSLYTPLSLNDARSIASILCWGETGYIYEGDSNEPFETYHYKAN